MNIEEWLSFVDYVCLGSRAEANERNMAQPPVSHRETNTVVIDMKEVSVMPSEFH